MAGGREEQKRKGPEVGFILFCDCKQGRLHGQEGRIFL